MSEIIRPIPKFGTGVATALAKPTGTNGAVQLVGDPLTPISLLIPTATSIASPATLRASLGLGEVSIAPTTGAAAVTQYPLGTGGWVRPAPTSLSKKIVIIGSSVAAGNGATDISLTWGFKFAQAMTARGYTVYNNSVPGHNVTNINARLHTDALAYNPDYVVIGLSLGNEGISTATTDADRETIYEVYQNGIAKAIRAIRQHGAIPVIAGVYPRGDYTAVHRVFLLRFNRWIETQGVICWDFLSALDNGDGTWKAGTVSDPLHPNNTGHQAMFSAINLDAFDAPVAQFGQTPSAYLSPGYVRTTAGNTPAAVFTPSTVPDSMTMAFWANLNPSSDSSIMGFTSTNGRVRNPGGATWNITTPSGLNLATTAGMRPNAWQHFALTYSNITKGLSLYVDGVLAGTLDCTSSPVTCDKFFIGGHSNQNLCIPGRYRDLIITRYPATVETIRGFMIGKYPLMSAEVISPMNEVLMDATVGESWQNYAVATKTAKLVATSYLTNPLSIDTGIAPPWAAPRSLVSVPATATSIGKGGETALGGGFRYDYTGDGTTHTWVRSAVAAW